MKRISKDELIKNKNIIGDEDSSIDAKKRAWKDIVYSKMNPRDNFDPETFDIRDNVHNYDVKKRSRVSPPRILPTMGMLPKEILQGQMVGMYESKQDLYLLIAWLSKRVSDLEDKLNN